jgi:hypothetical protein
MIDSRDVRIHKPTTADLEWAETNYFSFYVPEESLNGCIYVLTRANVAATLSTIVLFQGFRRHHWEALYADSRMHLPMPQGDLDDYRLPNGLHVSATDPPRNYEVDYRGQDGTEIHFRFRGLMEPYDIHDPRMDPIAAAEQGKEFSWGTAYKGHFDLTGSIEGEFVLRGHRSAISCVSTMDHSWGPRPEVGLPNMSWFHAHFGEDLAVHCIFPCEPDDFASYGPLAHGYVLENGNVYGLVSGHGNARREHGQQMTMTIEVRDVRGRTLQLNGHAIATYPWTPWPAVVAFHSLNEWSLGGRLGYGECMDVFDVTGLAARQARSSIRSSRSDFR